jgi:hypothetical protein
VGQILPERSNGVAKIQAVMKIFLIRCCPERKPGLRVGEKCGGTRRVYLTLGIMQWVIKVSSFNADRLSE